MHYSIRPASAYSHLQTSPINHGSQLGVPLRLDWRYLLSILGRNLKLLICCWLFLVSANNYPTYTTTITHSEWGPLLVQVFAAFRSSTLGYVGLIDGFVCWLEDVPSKAIFRTLSGILMAAWGWVGLTAAS